MSSGKNKTLFHEDLEILLGTDLERDVDISHLIIPFSKVFKSYKTKDIYSGEEKIPFTSRDIEYKKVFLEEFI